VLKNEPKMVGITHETAKNLRFKALKWMVLQDKDLKILKGFLRHPFKYIKNYISSLCAKNPYTREGDFFYYGIKNKAAFYQRLQEKNTFLLVGFSYCHKPFECPSKRFSDECAHNPDHPVCRQCFIGKCINALPEKQAIPVIIPTVHAIGKEVIKWMEKEPDKKLIFLITACEMTLKMFADFGNMAQVEGVGVCLKGRICNTMKAFELSERGIKPGLTVVHNEAMLQMVEFIKFRTKVFK
jgi:hypothetical protein